jgi:hypothetical protein
MDLPSSAQQQQRSWHLADHIGNPEVQRALERLRNGVLRGAIVGCTLRGGLHLLGAALTPLTGRKKRRSVTPRAAFWDTLRYTAFLGSLAGIYIGVDEGIAGAFGKRRWASSGLHAGCAEPPVPAAYVLAAARTAYLALVYHTAHIMLWF